MSFLYFGLLAAHIAFGALLAVVLIRWARRHGKAGWKFSVPIVIASYLVVFWDVVPTAVVHSYLCRTQAGVTIYKDRNTWMLEHANDVSSIPKFFGDEQFKINETRRGYWLNGRFYIQHDSDKTILLPVYINRQSINDGETGATLVEQRWVSSGYRKPLLEESSLSWLKGWVGLEDCIVELDRFTDQYRQFSKMSGAIE